MVTAKRPDHLERRLARLLQVGTVVITAILGLGILMHSTGMDSGIRIPATDWHLDLMVVGIAGFIVLPVLRVVVMLEAYLREQDRILALFAGLVLTIIAAGVVAGVMFSA